MRASFSLALTLAIVGLYLPSLVHGGPTLSMSISGGGDFFKSSSSKLVVTIANNGDAIGYGPYIEFSK